MRAKLALAVVVMAMVWIGSAVVAQTPGTAGALVLAAVALGAVLANAVRQALGPHF